MECQHSDEVIIVLTPDGYEAVDFYVFFPVDQYKIGCQTKIWTSADKTQQLEQTRGNALAGRSNEQQWQPLLQCEQFISYVGSDLSTDPQRPWIVGASTMAQHFSRSFFRYGIMGNWHGVTACAGWICFTGKMFALLVRLLVWLCILITFSESHCWTTVQKLMILVKRWTMKNVSFLISVDSARYGLKAQPPSIPVSIAWRDACPQFLEWSWLKK